MKRRWLGALALLGAVTAASCRPRESTVQPFAADTLGPRQVLLPVFSQQVTLWDRFVLRPDELGSAAADPARGLVYAAGREGTLLALSDRDGKVVWERKLSTGGVFGTPVLSEDGGLLYVGTDDGEMHAIDLESHVSRWSYATEGTIRMRPVLHAGVLYLSNSHQDVFALDAADGTWRWQYTRDVVADVNTVAGRAGVTLHTTAVAAAEPDAEESPAAAEGGSGGEPLPAATGATTLYTGFDDGKVAALDAATGEVVWLSSVAPAEGGPFVDCDSTPLVLPERGEVVVAGQASGIHGLSLEDGSTQWTFAVRGAGAVSRGPGALLLFTSALEGLFAIEPEGALRWRQQFDPGIPSAPVLVGTTALVGHSEVGLLAFDAASGELLQRFDTGSGLSGTPAWDPESHRLYAVSNRGQLTAFSLE